MPTSIGAVVMIGPEGMTPQERLVSAAIRISAVDLIQKLFRQGVGPIVLAGPVLDWVPDSLSVIKSLDHGKFHFGQRLAELIEDYELSSVLYFGGGSAPLLENEFLAMLIGMLARANADGSGIPGKIALTNNLHSSDWLGISRAQDALEIIRAAERDNGLAWMLQQNRDYDVRVLSGIRPATSFDIDTPADVAILRIHPACPDQIKNASQNSLLDAIPIDELIDIVARSGSRIAILGRVAPLAWQALSKSSQCWIRVYSEERGMIASERHMRGEVQSLVLTLVELLGGAGFFDRLSEVADAAIIDTRVLMAARGAMPSDADRFASDLLRPDWIEDGWLREFTRSAASAPIPVILGGHGVVSGGLYVLTEIVAQKRSSGS